MSIPLKKVIEIKSPLLPDPFGKYWRSKDRLNREFWRFYLVDGELYINDSIYEKAGDDALLSHWTQVGCCGVQCFLTDFNIKENLTMPYVRTNGEFLFETIKSDDYETSVRSPIDGQCFVVHSG